MKKTKLQKLTPLLIVLLGFFTLGLSDLVFIYVISDRFNCKKFLPMKQLSLMIVTLGIYGIFWSYRVASEMRKEKMIKEYWKAPICALLAIFFMRNISVLIIYNALDAANSKKNLAEEAE